VHRDGFGDVSDQKPRDPAQPVRTDDDQALDHSFTGRLG
jgi:hypothetical protein